MKRQRPKSFGELRKEWLPNGESDHINYCIPISLGVVAQDASYQNSDIEAAVRTVMKRLKKCFGRFNKTNRTKSHNQLIVMWQNNNSLARYIADYLQKEYGAQTVAASDEEIKKYCWVTIAAWDGIASDTSKVYNTTINEHGKKVHKK